MGKWDAKIWVPVVVIVIIAVAFFASQQDRGLRPTGAPGQQTIPPLIPPEYFVSCAGRNETDCKKENKCEWFGICQGAGFPCYEYNNNADCVGNPRCIWDQAGGFCKPKCGIHTDEKSCEADKSGGCKWVASCVPKKAH